MYMATKYASPCYVYAITPGSNRYKIGRTKNLKVRLITLQTGNDELLRIAYYHSFPDCKKAEETLHTIFDAYKKRLEWFHLDRQASALLEMIFTQQTMSEYDTEKLRRLELLW